MLTALKAAIPDTAATAVMAAAYAHDVGKSHKIWQDALCALAPPERRPTIDAGRPWAKSDRTGQLKFAGDVQFRHELASLLMLDGPLHGLLAHPGALSILSMTGSTRPEASRRIGVRT